VRFSLTYFFFNPNASLSSFPRRSSFSSLSLSLCYAKAKNRRAAGVVQHDGRGEERGDRDRHRAVGQHAVLREATKAGRRVLASPSSLDITISEAVEVAAAGAGTKYCLGSVIGEECLQQLAAFGEVLDVVVGCTGGRSNFGGLVFPFMREKLRGLNPHTLMKMHTLGHEFVLDPIHAGGPSFFYKLLLLSSVKYEFIIAHGSAWI
jgi:hypothetical protein